MTPAESARPGSGLPPSDWSVEENKEKAAAVNPPGDTTKPDRVRSLDRQLAVGKELFTGCLALLIVGATMFAGVLAVFLSGDTEAWQRAKDVLVLLAGLAGVVLGYYFGRVPADSRTARAESEAEASEQKRSEARAAFRSLTVSKDGYRNGTDVVVPAKELERVLKLLD